MLAYELFLANKKTNRNLDAKNISPIKKIFVSNGTITIDPKTQEDYGSKKFSENDLLQDWLSMPSWASNPKKLNLPDKRTGKRSPTPYVEFDCLYKKNRKEEKIIVSIPEERSGVLLALIANDGELTTKQYAKISGVSRGTVYTRFEEMDKLDITQCAKKSGKTKPFEAITLKEEWEFLKHMTK
tara:strand:- start:58 stop:609 length:552 start_codon:yes stop_codon:yes gene_type:complete